MLPVNTVSNFLGCSLQGNCEEVNEHIKIDGAVVKSAYRYDLIKCDSQCLVQKVTHVTHISKGFISQQSEGELRTAPQDTGPSAFEESFWAFFSPDLSKGVHNTVVVGLLNLQASLYNIYYT